MASPRNQIEEIFYFDQTGVTRLYNQIKGGNAESFTRETGSNNEYSGSLKPELGVDSIWSKFLPTMKIASELTNKRSKVTKTVENHSMTAEERYAQLLTFLDKSGELRHGLHDGWLNALARGGRSFCLFDAKFHPEPVPSNDWVLEANERQTIIVTDSNRQYRMGLGFASLLDVRGDRFYSTCHTAMRMRGGANIRALGSIEKGKYIKPYVVMWS